ncbi:MAG TPA: ATP-binding protein [Candidatus Anaerostipes excrementavium]|uniref:ATP-binding protein n=1 Tax=Candidatus Anaerostipes excrementavium TaxID=2838463 RepID=A0A9D1WW87_9FIRM|nr:AAA family ATPase [uncultured Anaerostipes sp.]HIX68062.1 ATP-binding protein [Candidatus Anaerostipes excrementavium]
MSWTPLPVGIENFKEMIEKGYYYVDKTLLIQDLMDLKGKVTLFTRPRRFGKTLNMSMLRYFFERSDEDRRTLFEGTKIMEAGEIYKKEMGRYPVISLSFKSMKQASYEDAFYCIKEEIAREYKRHSNIAEQLDSKQEQKKYQRFMDRNAEPEEYLTALQFLSECLCSCYEKRTVILIDEYDVPLENSYFCGFYNEMVSFIRSLFESALKTNDTLEFAVITGCLRISKESIFTGLNNLNIISILDRSYAEHFGFTQSEVDQMLSHYGLEQKRETVKIWYDGYQFGDTEVYNPWSVINYINSCYKNRNEFCRPYWSNTSSNSIVRTLVEKADLSVRQEIEALIAGNTIEKPVHEDITYDDMDSTQDNLWNFLLFTGYLKKVKERQNGETIYMEMAIPNTEVLYIYKNTVLRWFEDQIKAKELLPFYDSILNGECEKIAEILSENLMETISFYDYQESYYHGFLAGMLKNMGNYIVLSNRESGNGRPDILIKHPSVKGKAVIIEIKTAKTYQQLEEKCREALRQIEDHKYEEILKQEGYQDILKYGIAFYKKECMVNQI